MTDYSDAAQIDVPIPGSAYQVIVGAGLLDQLADLVKVPRHAEQAALVTSEPVRQLYADRVVAGFSELGLTVELVIVPDGEAAKTLAVLESCWDRFAQLGLEKRDIVIGLGGGAVGDLAGFAAATWGFGVDIVQIPTTLVAQVDSAIGGKTGVNLPEGKNLVGAFYQPFAVIADTLSLGTLPDRDRRAGLAEVVKYGFIADPVILQLLEGSPDAAVEGDARLLTELVRRSVAVKARVVAGDELEAGSRSLLNYGHTVGHAIETLSNYQQYRHGEAISLGMVFAARLGERMGISEQGLVDRTVALLKRLGLPTGGVELDIRSTWKVLGRDKKARGGVRFVLCRRPGTAILVDQPEPELINEVLASLSYQT